MLKWWCCNRTAHSGVDDCSTHWATSRPVPSTFSGGAVQSSLPLIRQLKCCWVKTRRCLPLSYKSLFLNFKRQIKQWEDFLTVGGVDCWLLIPCRRQHISCTKHNITTVSSAAKQHIYLLKSHIHLIYCPVYWFTFAVALPFSDFYTVYTS